jgi:hypothetical protein
MQKPRHANLELPGNSQKTPAEAARISPIISRKAQNRAIRMNKALPCNTRP